MDVLSFLSLSFLSTVPTLLLLPWYFSLLGSADWPPGSTPRRKFWLTSKQSQTVLQTVKPVIALSMKCLWLVFYIAKAVSEHKESTRWITHFFSYIVEGEGYNHFMLKKQVAFIHFGHEIGKKPLEHACSRAAPIPRVPFIRSSSPLSSPQRRYEEDCQRRNPWHHNAVLNASFIAKPIMTTL